MIVFDLACSHGHAFEGWFASAEEFARQQASELVRCPVCDDAQVEKRLSARVSVPKGARAPQPPATETATETAVAGFPAELITKLREAVRSAENVGRRFPEEARKIHYEETPARAIRGQATREEADALQEEGIDFTSLPSTLVTETH
jgi:hypothetical protein